MWASQFQKLEVVEGVEIREGGNQTLAMKQENSTGRRAMRAKSQSHQNIQRSGLGGSNKEAKLESQD